MNILFVNKDNGAGVEFEGNLFIDILQRTIGIDNLDVYSSQCRNVMGNFDFSVYDLIILNDFNINDYSDFNDVEIPIININFGGEGARSVNVDIVIDLNIAYTSYYETDMYNYYPLNFISGNIWKSLTNWNDRSNEILYVSRLNENKIVQRFLDYLRENNKVANFYGHISDQDYYEKNKDVINYKGFISHRELLNIYNEYKLIYLSSTTECLSMTLREAILCGTVPVVFDDINYTKPIENYIFKHNGIIPNQEVLLEITEEIHDYTESNRHFLENYFSFDKMILDFVYCIRGLMLKDLKFDKNHRNNINYLHTKDNKSDYFVYDNDTIDWNNVLV